MVQVPGYTIERLLAWGAQGDVFLAGDAAGGRVALKLVTDDRGDGDPLARERLAREARMLATVDSPHVVRLRDFLSGDGWSCLVLEYLEGERLDAAMRRRAGTAIEAAAAPGTTVLLPEANRAAAASTPALPQPTIHAAAPSLRTSSHVEWVLDIAQQIAAGVAALHARGLVHRDVKPQNVMLVGERAVLIDFGVARGQGFTTLTQTGSAVGTLAYLGPEQLHHERATAASDVYAIGATLFHCLIGAPPIGGDVRDLARIAARSRPPDVLAANPAVGRDLARVVQRCLEPYPGDRHPDAEALLADLRRCAIQAPVHTPFSAGRIFRHWRKRVALAAGALITTAAVTLWVTHDTLAARGARMLAAAARADDGAARSEWTATEPGERRALLDELQERLAADVISATQLAKTLDLGLLVIAGRAGHRATLCESRSDGGSAPPGRFVALDDTRCLLAANGRCWLSVQSTAPRFWWAADDPRCVLCLIDVPTLTTAPAARSIAILPTEVRGSIPSALVPNLDLRVGTHEVDDGTLHRFRLAMRGQARSGERAAIDAWLRHPDEPDDVRQALWQSFASATDEDLTDRRPARTSFWEAFRCAAWQAHRLPTREEWRAFGPAAVPDLPKFAPVPTTPSPVDADPGWDRSTAGLCFCCSNVSEWTLTRTPRGALIVPGQAEIADVLSFTTRFSIDHPVSPMALHGMRFVRPRLRP